MALFKKKEDTRTEEEKILEKYGATINDGMITWFTSALKEARTTITNQQQMQTVSALTVVYPDHMEIFKKSAITSRTKGVKKIFFKNITSIDLDTPGKLSVTYSIEITISGSKKISLASADKNMPVYYEQLDEAFTSYQTNSDVAGDSVADELERIMNMYEKGLLTDDEFAVMKQRIINQ